MKDEVVRARINAELKASAVQVLSGCGLELSDAIRVFLQQVVVHQGLPFDVRSAQHEPSVAELRQWKQDSQERDRRIARSADVSEGQMLLLRPERLRGAKVRWPKATGRTATRRPRAHR